MILITADVSYTLIAVIALRIITSSRLNVTV